MKSLRTIGAGLVAVVAVAAAWAAVALSDSTVRVVGVQDGDTVTVFSPGSPQTRVRLVEIDAPESAQPYGQSSKQVLSSLVFGRSVMIRSEGQDRYGRTLARIYVGDLDVNKEMVRRGAAWVYTDYNKDPSFPPLQARARQQRAGLWALQADQITPPWEWRRAGGRTAVNDNAPLRERFASRPQARQTTPATGGRCAGKRRCAEMTNCAEARFYLSQCGVGTLDGDKDGVPCEAICG